MNTCQHIGPNKDTKWLLFILVVAILCAMLSGCKGSSYVTGVHTEQPRIVENTKPPKVKPLLERAGAKISQPVEIREYKEPPVGYGVPEAFYEAEIDAARGEMTLRFEDYEVTTKLPAPGETKTMRFDAENEEWADRITEIVEGEAEIPKERKRGMGIGRILRIVIIVVIVAAGIYVLSFIRGLLGLWSGR